MLNEIVYFSFGMDKKAQIRHLIHGQPVQPVSISMQSGRVFEIPHPDFVAFAEADDPFIYVMEKGVMYALAVDAIETFISPPRYAR